VPFPDYELANQLQQQEEEEDRRQATSNSSTTTGTPQANDSSTYYSQNTHSTMTDTTNPATTTQAVVLPPPVHTTPVAPRAFGAPTTSPIKHTVVLGGSSVPNRRTIPNIYSKAYKNEQKLRQIQEQQKKVAAIFTNQSKPPPSTTTTQNSTPNTSTNNTSMQTPNMSITVTTTAPGANINSTPFTTTVGINNNNNNTNTNHYNSNTIVATTPANHHTPHPSTTTNTRGANYEWAPPNRTPYDLNNLFPIHNVQHKAFPAFKKLICEIFHTHWDKQCRQLDRAKANAAIAAYANKHAITNLTDDTAAIIQNEPTMDPKVMKDLITEQCKKEIKGYHNRLNKLEQTTLRSSPKASHASTPQLDSDDDSEGNKKPPAKNLKRGQRNTGPQPKAKKQKPSPKEPTLAPPATAPPTTLTEETTPIYNTIAGVPTDISIEERTTNSQTTNDIPTKKAPAKGVLRQSKYQRPTGRGA
jgi:hypothetical protein